MKQVGQRVFFAMMTLLAVTLVTFLATSVLPADPARLALGRQATDAQLDAFRDQQGLDQPVVTRYVAWLGDAVSGEFGDSTRTRNPVGDGIGGRLQRTLTLAALAGVIAVPFALALGAFMGQRPRTKSDIAIVTLSVAVSSTPEFVIGIGLLAVFAVWLGWLPVESSGALYGDLGAQIEAYVLPLACLTILMVPYIARVFRVNVRETTNEPFIRSAMLRGLSHGQIVRSHLFPNALVPSVNVIALSVAEIAAGDVVIETVFGFPGVGKEYVDAVLAKDIPVVQALTLVAGAAFVVMNLAADTLQRALDPRIAIGGRT
jgi:peptide/nickel transport system permease protein